MKRTAQAAILAAAEREIGAAVGAVPIEQAVATGGIAKQHQVLAKQTQPPDRARLIEFLHQRGGLPVAAHQGATWRARTGLGDAPVLLRGEHASRPFSNSLAKQYCRRWRSPQIFHLVGRLGVRRP